MGRILRRNIIIGDIRAENAGDAEARVVALSLSSEAPCARELGMVEILDHDPEAVDLSRLADGGVVLWNHNRDAVIGKVLSVWIDDEAHKLRARVQFDDDKDSDKIYRKVLSGTLRGVSVGYVVDTWEDVEEGRQSEDGRFRGACSIARHWTPYELSIVSVPADATVGVGRSFMENGGISMRDDELHKKKRKKPAIDDDTPENEDVEDEDGEEEDHVDDELDDEDEEDDGTEDEDKDTVSKKKNKQKKKAGEEAMNAIALAKRDGVRAERVRVREIMAMCRQFGMDGQSYVDNGCSVNEARARLLSVLARNHAPHEVTLGVDAMDKFRAAAIDGLAMRAGVRVEKPAFGANEFRGKRLLRIAAECLEREKQMNTHRMDDEMLLREALTGTGAFPGILSNVANKSMAQAYQTAPTTYQLWTAAGTNVDFKQATRYRLGEADELEKITESGEFAAGNVVEGAARAAVATYGKTFSLTRQAIINDDLGALQTLPSIYGAAARRMINRMVYGLLESNPDIEGAKLFSTAHNTVPSANAPLTVEGLAKLKAAMARQTNLGGKEKLNIQPAYLIVPVELEAQAAQLINSVVDPSKNNAAINPFANRMTVIADPELTDAATYYLAAAPGYAPTIEVTSLNGNVTPTMESAVQFDTLGIKWRIYQDVGVNLLDYRGIQRSTK